MPVEMKGKRVIIMRGIPGSGKTTFWKKHHPEAVCCSANDYFTDADGVYRYVREQFRESHAYCQEVFMRAIKDNEPLIVVDNTAVKMWEVEGYAQNARRYGYDVIVYRMIIDDWMEAAKRSIHEVPKGKVERMHFAFEDCLGETRIGC